MKFTESIFELLLENKSLPYYQAERRIDIFVNLFLSEILNYSLKKTGIQYVLPELPLKKEMGHRSTKVDYLCFDSNEKIIYFVELKTDSNSFKGGQLDIYQAYKTWEQCQSDIKAITKISKAKPKFEKLNMKLHSLNLLDESSSSYKIKIVYIAPESSSTRKKIISKDKLNNVSYIAFSELSAFNSTLYPAEWQLFYSKFLVEI